MLWLSMEIAGSLIIHKLAQAPEDKSWKVLCHNVFSTQKLITQMLKGKTVGDNIK